MAMIGVDVGVGAPASTSRISGKVASHGATGSRIGQRGAAGAFDALMSDLSADESQDVAAASDGDGRSRVRDDGPGRGPALSAHRGLHTATAGSHGRHVDSERGGHGGSGSLVDARSEGDNGVFPDGTGVGEGRQRRGDSPLADFDAQVTERPESVDVAWPEAAPPSPLIQIAEPVQTAAPILADAGNGEADGLFAVLTSVELPQGPPADGASPAVWGNPWTAGREEPTGRSQAAWYGPEAVAAAATGDVDVVDPAQQQPTQMPAEGPSLNGWLMATKADTARAEPRVAVSAADGGATQPARPATSRDEQTRMIVLTELRRALAAMSRQGDEPGVTASQVAAPDVGLPVSTQETAVHSQANAAGIAAWEPLRRAGLADGSLTWEGGADERQSGVDRRISYASLDAGRTAQPESSDAGVVWRESLQTGDAATSRIEPGSAPDVPLVLPSPASQETIGVPGTEVRQALVLPKEPVRLEEPVLDARSHTSQPENGPVAPKAAAGTTGETPATAPFPVPPASEAPGDTAVSETQGHRAPTAGASIEEYVSARRHTPNVDGAPVDRAGQVEQQPAANVDATAEAGAQNAGSAAVWRQAMTQRQPHDELQRAAEGRQALRPRGLNKTAGSVQGQPGEPLQREASSPFEPTLAMPGDESQSTAPRGVRNADAGPVAVTMSTGSKRANESTRRFEPDAASVTMMPGDVFGGAPGSQAGHAEPAALVASEKVSRPSAHAARAIAAFQAASLAPAASAHAGSPLSAVPRATFDAALEQQVTGQLVDAVRVQADQGGGQARITLNPTFLGEVAIDVRTEGNSVVASVHAANADVREWMRTNEGALRQSLADQGLSLAQFVIVDEETDNGQSRRDHESRGQQEQQEQWQRRNRQTPEHSTFEIVL